MPRVNVVSRLTVDTRKFFTSKGLLRRVHVFRGLAGCHQSGQYAYRDRRQRKRQFRRSGLRVLTRSHEQTV